MSNFYMRHAGGIAMLDSYFKRQDAAFVVRLFSTETETIEADETGATSAYIVATIASQVQEVDITTVSSATVELHLPTTAFNEVTFNFSAELDQIGSKVKGFSLVDVTDDPEIIVYSEFFPAEFDVATGKTLLFRPKFRLGNTSEVNALNS